ncbi:MAG: hypothetical protein J1G06_08645 [Oscillospiraceae bacterium]|nr:hypothetical protein [Oscillospiraceae bacterium]
MYFTQGLIFGLTIGTVIGGFIGAVIMAAVQVGRRRKAEMNNKNCRNCRKHKTMECPNSAECYVFAIKPHFEPKEDTQ